ncbi:PTS system, sucrose-specific IIB component [Spiroplasma chinense]|uniref:PTS system, sucrose-specific IIB component n=1 Tax=Spiroplasma chinense TaxID=216932 RepID=A0A5B9Y7W8_9MOLU|nr:PTS transporter subunit EIIC [Spiroplasma chinense]QEH62182.1 PTS system, sucrose-specific IIB component [Spiroplasma chinense]
MKKIEWEKYSQEFFEAVGGMKNVKDIYHCATRLRFHLVDEEKIDISALKKIAIVKGYNLSEDEHQLIIGTGVVDKFYKVVMRTFEGNGEVNLATKNKVKFWNKNLNFKQNSLALTKRGLNSFAAIFVPLVPVFIAGGMSLALKSLFEQITPNSGFGKILDIIGGGILGSVPAFVGFTAAKRWGGNPYLGMSMGIILIAPALLNSWSNSSPVMIGVDINATEDVVKIAIQEAFDKWKDQKIGEGWTPEQLEAATSGEVIGVYYTIWSGFFKINLIGYQAQIVPILLVLALSVNLERLFRKFIPDTVGIILVPLGVVLISSWLAFWAIGPLGQIIGKGIALGLNGLFKYTNWYGIGFGGMVFAGLYPLIVITGLHQGLLPIDTQLLLETKLQYGHSFSFITPIACASNVAQGCAVLVAAFLIKNKEEKSKVFSGSFGANLGITEPAMFGVNLQIKPLFVGGMIGSAAGGYWSGMTHTVANSVGSASWVGLVQFDWTSTKSSAYFDQTNIHASFQSIPPGVNAVIVMLISGVVAFAASWFLMKTKWGKNSLNEYITNMDIVIESKKERIKKVKNK